MFSNSKHKVEWGNGLDREAGARDIMRSLVAYWKQRHRESRKRVAGWRARRGVQGARDLSLSQKRAGRKARARRILGNEDTRRGQRWMKEFWREVQKPLEKRRKKRKKRKEEREKKRKGRKKCTAAGKSQTRGTYTCAAKQPHTYRWPGMPGNFSMAPAELEFSLIFTFSRHPPRGSAIVRAASLRPPTTITEKMQRTAAEYTYLPTLTTHRREAVDSNSLQ